MGAALFTSRRFSHFVAPAAAFLLSTPAAFAADSAAGGSTAVLEIVEVTSIRQPYRGDTPLNELPQSVQILDADLLKDVGAVQLDTALDMASGVARQNTLGGLWDSFAIRGFAGDENTPSGYLVNGFNAGRGFSGRRDPSSIERIEVLKGPGSALYGRGEPGGTINIVTKQPEFIYGGSVDVSGGSFDTYRVAGDYTGPLSESIAFRINGAYQDAGSFRDFVESKRYTASPSVLFRIAPATAVSYAFEWVKQEAPLDRGVTAVDLDPNPSPTGVRWTLGQIPRERFLGEPGDGDIDIEALGHMLTLEHQFNGNWSLLVGGSRRTSTFEGFSSEAELLNSRQLLFTSAASGLVTRRHLFRTYDTTDTNGRAELSGKFSTGPIVHHVLVGADAYKFDNDQQQTRFRPGASLVANQVYSLNIYNPVYGIASPALVPLTDRLEVQKDTGIYLQDQIDLTERWKLLGGVRYDDYSQDITNRLGGAVSKVSQTATSPRAGLVFQATPQISLFTAYSKGFRPNTGSSFAGDPFPAETSRSYEGGVKLETEDQRFNGTLAVYKGEKTNFLTADPVNAGFSIAGGEAESKGVELDAAGQLTDAMRFTFSYAYTDAEVTKDIVDFNFSYFIPAGSPLINIPEHSAHALLIQEFDVGGKELTVGGGVNYVGERLGETGYLPRFDLPSYTLFNLLGSYEATESLKVGFHVDNLFDKTYYPSSYSRFWVAVGAPRSYTVSAEYKF
jgi:iron complex outermembrane receptor protein